MIRVAVLAERLGTSAGGTEVYERCVLKALHEQAAIAGDIEIVPVLAWRRALDFIPGTLRPSCRLLCPEGKVGTALTAWWSIRRVAADVVHCCFVVPPWLGDLPVVATVHDLGFVRRRDHYPALLSWRLVKALHYAVRRADLIAAVSESTRRDLLELTAANPEKVIAVHNGLDENFTLDDKETGRRNVLGRHGIREPYILYAGKLEPRKNVPSLIDAFDRLKETGRFGGQLVLMGSGRTFMWEVAQRRIDRSPFKADIVQTGYVPDREVPGLYSRASVLAFVSLYEGFGFPVLEAMASGVPVVCSDSTCLPEIVGDAAVLVDAEDPHRIADALSRVLNDRKFSAELAAKGLERAKLFTWRRTAERFIDAYRMLAAGRGSRSCRATKGDGTG